MRALKGRVKKAEADAISKRSENIILVSWPNGGLTYGNRQFRDVEEAVSILEKETGRVLNPVIFRVKFEDTTIARA